HRAGDDTGRAAWSRISAAPGLQQRPDLRINVGCARPAGADADAHDDGGRMRTDGAVRTAGPGIAAIAQAGLADLQCAGCRRARQIALPSENAFEDLSVDHR